jgi:hypothetical protein
MINFVMNMFVLNSVEQTENFSNMNEVTDWRKAVAKYKFNTMKSKYKISTYSNFISVLRGMHHQRYRTPTYVRSLAITMAMGPTAPLWHTAVPSAWGIAPFLSFEVYNVRCCRLAEVQLNWSSAPTQTCYIASYDAMSTPCPLFRKHNALCSNTRSFYQCSAFHTNQRMH